MLLKKVRAQLNRPDGTFGKLPYGRLIIVHVVGGKEETTRWTPSAEELNAELEKLISDGKTGIAGMTEIIRVRAEIQAHFAKYSGK